MTAPTHTSVGLVPLVFWWLMSMIGAFRAGWHLRALIELKRKAEVTRGRDA
jgi:hypothetical protein